MLLIIILLLAWSAALVATVVYMRYQFKWKNEYRVYIYPDENEDIIVSQANKLVGYGPLSSLENIVRNHFYNNKTNHDEAKN